MAAWRCGWRSSVVSRSRTTVHARGPWAMNRLSDGWAKAPSNPGSRPVPASAARSTTLEPMATPTRAGAPPTENTP